MVRRAKITSAPMVPLREPTPEASDSDDARSFGIESEFYGDATIASTPGVQSRNQSLQASLPKRRQTQIYPPEPPRSATPSSASSEEQQSEASRSDGTPERETELPVRTGLLSDPPRRRRKILDPSYKDGGASQSSDDDGQHQTRRNTGRPQFNSVAEDDELDEDHLPASAKGYLRQRRPKNSNLPDETPRRLPLSQRSGNGDSPADSGQWHRTNLNMAHQPGGFFAKAKQLAAAASPFGRKGYPRSDHSDLDDAMQEAIETSQGSSPVQTWVDEQPWHQRWAWLRQKPQSVPSNHSDQPEEDGDEEEDDENDKESRSSDNLSEIETSGGLLRWLRWLNPYTYFQLSVWFVSSVFGAIRSALDFIFPTTLRDGFWTSLEGFLYLVSFAIALITVIGILQGSILSFIDEDFSLVPDPVRVHLPDVSSMFDSVHWNVPSISIPRLRWPYRSSGRLPDEWRLSFANISDPEEYFKAYTDDLATLKSSAEMHDLSLQKLNSILPKVVHMELKNGKPVVSAEFWHSLSELVQQDDSYALFDKSGGVYQLKSGKQIKALAAQIGNEPTFSKKMSEMGTAVETRLRKEQSAQWAAWVRNNEKRVSGDKSSEKGSGSLVSKDSFLHILHEELATHRREIQAELTRMQPDLDKLVREAAQLASQSIPEGLDRGQITTLVHGLVQKYIADVNLGAVAKGKIHAHWDSVLKHQVNYFGAGSGAVVDGKYSSQSYRPAKSKVSESDIRKGLAVEISQPAVAALLPWREDGQCWCAARSLSRRKNPHGATLSVLLSKRIVPEYLAIENILPWATVDPGARPKDVEVYADVDKGVRDRVRDFSATHFPDNKADWDFTPPEYPERFIKIGQFVYKDVKRQPNDKSRHAKREDEELPDEVQVFQFSSELAELGLETEQVIVRATSNYGEKDYTCFYRVRLFGKAIDDRVNWRRTSF